MSANETVSVYSLMSVSPGTKSASSRYREQKYSDGEQNKGTEREK